MKLSHITRSENDILSIRKELAGGCVHNAVPVMYHHGQILDDLVHELMVRLEACRDRFDDAADRVCEMVSSSSEKDCKDLVRYVDGLRTNGTGTIEFRYVEDSTISSCVDDIVLLDCRTLILT